eukprot:CAMPEP_0204151200 /NCGR_PEP_ID=MMETSP0361-20130328/25949_1 /ASSEMBLY_ACC=CAM_ASM_000343 /TAXON_ID=268821 /ORGANISM="Scrippsiella Hangoei, Strain SHTV-5" /LENGTH=79 /DNA_ID=CAMNT_0051105995 /DNA_START=223 /DNA_END=466 /DNA_ORIENTATION=-
MELGAERVCAQTGPTAANASSKQAASLAAEHAAAVPANFWATSWQSEELKQRVKADGTRGRSTMTMPVANGRIATSTLE